jgi:predicted amidohydrolase
MLERSFQEIYLFLPAKKQAGMKLSAAQITSAGENIHENFRIHTEMIRKAAGSGADLILFPEMSLTGYEREKAAGLSFRPGDPKLDVLKRLAIDLRILIIAGAPLTIDGNCYIGAFILPQDGSEMIYIKKYLHKGEEEYFYASRAYDPVVDFQDERISLAICADIENPDHPLNANHVNHCSLYLAGIFYSAKGISGAHERLGEYAGKYGMNVLMANYCRKHWGVEAGGGSAFWDSKGKRIAFLNPDDPGLLLVEKKDGEWLPESTGRNAYISGWNELTAS